MQEIFHIFLEKIPKEVLWHADMRTNLLIQGISVNPKTIDIATNKEGLEVIKKIFKSSIMQDFCDQEKMCETIHLHILDEDIEVHCYVDENLGRFDKIKIFDYEGMKIPVLPLEEALRVYEILGNVTRVRTIKEFLRK